MNSMIGDIVERDSSTSAPKEPTPKSMPQSIPKKKWGERRRPVVLDPSATQPQPSVGPPRSGSGSQTTNNKSSTSSSGSKDAPLSEPEKMHLENIRRMQQMTPEQIEQEREEIFRTMDPNVLQSLLRRAELKEQETDFETKGKSSQTPESMEPKPKTHMKQEPAHSKASTEAPTGASKDTRTQAETEDTSKTHTKPSVFQSQRLSKGAALDKDEVDDLLGLDSPKLDSPKLDIPAQSEQQESRNAQLLSQPAESTVHFPPPPEELKKYFPDLPVETEKLAWMQPIADEEEQEYSDQLVSVAPSELRFDFNGNLITPRVSRLIDPSMGLHHHGDAPSAAGYTFPELAHLSRSSHPAQRAMAIQTVGRVLHKFRLRKFAKSSELQEGLDRLIKATRIMETLEEAADDHTRNLTVRTNATEALWLANTSPNTKNSSNPNTSNLA